METTLRTAHKKGTGEKYDIPMPTREVVRRAILELEWPHEGLTIAETAKILAEKLGLSDEQKTAVKSGNNNVFRHSVVNEEFKELLKEGVLEQPGGKKTPYFLA